MSPRVRFAPSPSGYLHIGGARTALFNWLWARSQGGTFILRIEDTDQDRSSIESVRAVLDAMKWLGLDWDEGPEVGGDYGPYFQSDRRERYHEVTEQLIANGHAYRCYCTKEELDAQREALKADNPKAQFKYPGTCRDRTDKPDLPAVVRMKVSTEGSVDFDDKVFGLISTPNKESQDFVIMRKDGFPLYNLAAAIDDHDMGITLVARGRDHIGNTPQQILIYRAMGWTPPEFAHLPMMLSPKGEKLSKRHASVGVQDYRDRGFTPEAVLNYLARFGWSYGDQEIFSRDELIQYFDWARCGRADGKFDEAKFKDVAFEHLKEAHLLDINSYADRVEPFLVLRGLEVPSRDKLIHAIELIRPRARDLVDAAQHLDFYFRASPVMDAKAQKKFLTKESVSVLERTIEFVDEQEEFEVAALETAFGVWLEKEGLEMKAVAQAVRVALSGRSASPGLFDVMVILGKDVVLRRLAEAVELCRLAE